ncbi:MAG: hypothetical protein FJ405_14165 [Verrucomicrobia bacterium]|nr:hypothetical protein [Verrucomicrobiota bacterium]
MTTLNVPMLAPVAATMRRRILVNFRGDPRRVARILAHPFRPKLVHGASLVGICLIRLEHLRPAWMPEPFGVASENAAHRIAVEWSESGSTREGVFVARRHTNSSLNKWVGGHLFPGVHHRGQFDCHETKGVIRVRFVATEGDTEVEVVARPSESMPPGSVFPTLEEASRFFSNGCDGWSVARDGTGLEGARLDADVWELKPLRIDKARSSLLDTWFHTPDGGLEFDSAFVMRDVPHRWHSLGPASGPGSVATTPRCRPHRRAALFELP